MNEVRFGASPDFSVTFGDRLRESLRRRLTLSGAREAWWDKNQDKLEKFRQIEEQMTPRQREQVAAKLERQANRNALGEVGLNYLALASLIGTIYVGGKILYDALIGLRLEPRLRKIGYAVRHPIESLRKTLARARGFAEAGRAHATSA